MDPAVAEATIVMAILYGCLGRASAAHHQAFREQVVKQRVAKREISHKTWAQFNPEKARQQAEDEKNGVQRRPRIEGGASGSGVGFYRPGESGGAK